MKRKTKFAILVLLAVLLAGITGYWLGEKKGSQTPDAVEALQDGRKISDDDPEAADHANGVVGDSVSGENVDANSAEESGGEGTGNSPEESSGSVNTWDSDSVYVGGDEVVYNGKIYKAKWWTQGETPGKADVWEDTLTAAEQPDWQVLGGQDGDGGSEASQSGRKRTDVEKWEDFKVVGYFPSWSDKTNKIQYDVLTHINYAFAIPTSEGGLLPLENEQNAKKIINEAHRRGVKVLIAVGGWSYHDVPLERTFMDAAETAKKRTKFVNAIMAMCDHYGFDGVDMDWEHPRVDGDSSRRYEAVMTELAARLHKEGKVLSSAVLSGVTVDGVVYYDAAAHTDKVLKAVDWLNVMAYDGGDGERHSAYDFAVNSAKYWSIYRKMPAEKVNLGVPFYARPSWAAYGDILNAVPGAAKKDHVEYNGMDVWYNSVGTIEKKTQYALDNLGGVMIWEVSQDADGDQSLQTAIGRTIKKSK